MHRPQLAAFWACALMAGCTRPIISPSDAGAAELDAPMAAPDALDAALDTGPLDAPVAALDANVLDSATDTAGADAPADVPSDSGSDAPLSLCVSAYGSLPGFALCDESPTHCTLYASGPMGTDCRDACALAAGSCLMAYRDDAMSCTLSAPRACGGNLPGVCVCALP